MAGLGFLKQIHSAIIFTTIYVCYLKVVSKFAINGTTGALIYDGARCAWSSSRTLVFRPLGPGFETRCIQVWGTFILRLIVQQPVHCL